VSGSQQDKSAVRAVILVGFMGAGKSSVGRRLGRLLGWPFADLDDHIQAREGRSIDQIFRESGEAKFRSAEHAALRELLESGPVGIVALGGGAFVQEQNALLISAINIPVVFLDAPVEELFRRCQEDTTERPLGSDLDQFRTLYESRKPFYERAAHHIDTAGKDLEAVAAEVTCKLGLG
jgi:shikimate kinase